MLTATMASPATFRRPHGDRNFGSGLATSLADVKNETNRFQSDMKNKTTTVITFEARQTTVVRRRRDHLFTWCSCCQGETVMFTANEFGRLIGLTPRQIYRQIEAGVFHFTEESDGTLLICGNSFQTNAQIQQNQTEGE
jgi:hypothetical protein